MENVGFMMNYKDLERLFTFSFKKYIKQNETNVDDIEDINDFEIDMEDLLLGCGFDEIKFCDVAELYNLKNGGIVKYKDEYMIILYAEKIGRYEKYENKEEIYKEIINKLNNMEHDGIKLCDVNVKSVEDSIGKIYNEVWD